MTALALASFWVAAPAAAWNVHGTAHIGASVAIDEHHAHEADGSIHVAPDTPSDDHPGDEGPGHDHMPSASTCVTAMLGEAPCLAPPPAAMTVAGTRTVATLVDLRHPPPARPPSSL